MYHEHRCDAPLRTAANPDALIVWTAQVAHTLLALYARTHVKISGVKHTEGILFSWVCAQVHRLCTEESEQALAGRHCARGGALQAPPESGSSSLDELLDAFPSPSSSDEVLAAGPSPSSSSSSDELSAPCTAPFVRCAAAAELPPPAWSPRKAAPAGLFPPAAPARVGLGLSAGPAAHSPADLRLAGACAAGGAGVAARLWRFAPSCGALPGALGAALLAAAGAPAAAQRRAQIPACDAQVLCT